MAKLYWIGNVAATTTNNLYTELKKVAGNSATAAAVSFGNIVAAEIAPAITYLDHFVSYKGERRKDKTVAIQKSISIPFTFDEINATNIKRFFSTNDVGSGKYGVMGGFTPQEGTAAVFFVTDVGHDFMYIIPRGALRAEGGMPFNIDAWINAKFTLEVLFSASYKASGTATLTPYGFIDWVSTGTVAP